MNLNLLGPELSLIGLAVVVILLDLVIKKKEAVAAIAGVGLLVPAVWTVTLFGQRGSSFAGALVVDNYSLFFNMIFLSAAALVILSSVEYSKRFAPYQGEYFAIILVATAGMMFMAGTQELITIYISLEMASISLYVLASFLRDAKSSEAGLKYLLLGAISSAVLLYGMALIYGATGVTNLNDIAQAIQASLRQDPNGILPAVFLGVVLMTAGFGFKIAAAPFHMWAPDVYEGAPTPVTGFLTAASKAAGFAVILRVFFVILGTDLPLPVEWPTLFAVLSALTMTVGNLMAIPQTNIKRMLAYSSIAHAGFMMVGVAAFSAQGLQGVFYYLLGYSFTSLGAFAVIIAISERLGSDRIADYSGVARRAPGLALALAICLTSLIGFPPTAGFVAKIYVFWAALQQGLLWLVLFGVLNSVVSAYYYLRVLRTMYLGAPSSDERLPVSKTLVVAMTVAVIAVLVIGILPTPWLNAGGGAAAVLIP
ncbi:MAG: NADH-quinone oxidoreductase subunit N [Dehalococcoidia bacterium]|nr:NADH-quinone oxidoreductase subunit N [Dehalococcoidia bacterium]